MNCISQASWKTKEDVLQDLTAIGQTKINDDYLVIGQRPPPPLREVDDEYDLRFGGTNYGEVSVAPDLNGIRQCLRMVDPSDDEEESTSKNNGEIVISKLNPFVKEFVPRATSSNSRLITKQSTSVTKSPGKLSTKSSETNASKSSQGNVNPASVSQSNRITSPPKLQQSNSSNAKSVTNREDSPSTSTQINNQIVNDETSNEAATTPIPDEIAKKTNELRNKISEFKVDSAKQRIQRNVAIANLLRLHSAKPSPCTSKSNLSSSTEEKELKLMTPDYFIKNTKDGPNEVNGEKTDDKVIDDKVDKVIDDKVDKATNDSVDKVDDETDLNVDTKSIQESIDKVNNWFEKPKTPTIPKISPSTVCLGPVSFKRKDPVAKSPNGSIVDAKVSKGNQAVAQFKPSKYAEDLAKKYMERSKAKERRGMTIWDNLEKELKEKDEEIRKKRAMEDNNV